MLEEVIDRVYKRSQSDSYETHYAGLLTIYAAARSYARSNKTEELRGVSERLSRYIRGEAAKVHGAYCTYQVGGNGAAYLYYLGKLPAAGARLLASAEELVREHVRDEEGIFAKPKQERNDMIWIDTAYPVVPFLTWIGLADGRDDLLQEAADQMRKMHGVLLDKSCGLLHQARGFAASGRLTEDHWSRGNGWALLALADVLDVLPASDPRHRDYTTMLRDLVTSTLAYQDPTGMWHQEITDPSSYPEVSGTGLILYAIGVGLRKGILDDPKFSDALERGISGLTRYIALDGSVHNCCRGCLAPGEGRIEDYKARGWIRNDVHAFGPVILALSEAIGQGLAEPRIRFEPAAREKNKCEYRCVDLL